MLKYSLFLLILIIIYYKYILPFLTKNINQFNYTKKNKKNKKRLEESDDIVIIYTNDVHCGINNTIGYDGLVLYRKILKQKYKNIITVDVGDAIQGGTLGAISEGEAIIKVMNKVGYDISIIGNHEIDYGIEKLLELEKNLKNGYICANFCYRKNKTTIFPPYKILEISNKKIAFIAITTPLTFSKTYLSTVRDEVGEQIYDLLSGKNGQELYDTVQNYINEVKEKKADYVILLSHIGMWGTEDYSSDIVVSNLEGVDAVLDGHTHLIYNTTTKDKLGKNIPISQAGSKLESIGVLFLKNDGSISTEIITEVPEPNIDIGGKKITRSNKEIWVDSEIYEFINDIFEEYNEELNILIGYSDFDLIINPNESSDELVYCRFKECTLGNLITDSLKTAGNADLCILNAGAITNNLKKGNITRGDILNILPWFDNIVVKELPGQIILDALEFGVSKLPNSSTGFPQVSGISYDININIESSVITDGNGMFIGFTNNRKRRVSNVKVNGVDMNLNKIYSVSLIDFIALGGDGYTMFNDYDIVYEAASTDSDYLAYYISKTLKGIIPEKYKNDEGRINIYEKNNFVKMICQFFIIFNFFFILIHILI